MKNKKDATTQQLEDKSALTPKLRFPEFRNAGEWITDALGIVFETSSGGTPDRAKEEYWNGNIPWITTSLVDFNIIMQAGEYISDLGLSNSSAKLFPKETILVAMYGQGKTRGKVALLGLQATTNQACAAILPRQDINSRFVFANLSCRYDEMRRLSNTGGQENLSQGLIKELQFSYPKDVNEQRRIADCFTSLDDLIAAQAQKLGDLKTHKKGLMQQLFPREGETQPRLRFPEFRNAGDWEFKTLKDIAEIRSGSTPLRSNEEFFAEGNIPWVKTTDLNNSYIEETEEKITPKAKARVNPLGSILVAMYGGFNQIGRTGCLRVPAATNQAISVLVLDREIALPAYVLAWLNAKVENWKRIASSSRKDPNITSSDVTKFPITLPDIKEQQRIANCLISLDELIATQTEKVNSLKTHKKGLMQQLFPSREKIEA
jgi:type I restriction enzyme, S subunit